MGKLEKMHQAYNTKALHSMMRYESSLERFYRAFHELQRMQRLKQGQATLFAGKYFGGIHGPDDMSFSDIYSAHLAANDRFIKKTETSMASSPYANGDLYHLTRGITYTGMDFASAFLFPFGQLKTAASAGKAILRAEKIAHSSPTLLKTSLVTGKVFKSSSNAKGFLTRSKIKSYLSIAPSKSKSQIISDLESVGLKLKGKSPDGRFLNFQDRFGNLRVKIHPPDKITPYDHLHIYDRKENPLNKHLEIVNRRSIDAHIPYGGGK